MAAYIITYDLNQETVRPKIVEKIKKTWSSAMLSESSYAIISSASPKAIYEELSVMLDQNDFIYVIAITQPYYGYGEEDVNAWLAAHIPE